MLKKKPNHPKLGHHIEFLAFYFYSTRCDFVVVEVYPTNNRTLHVRISSNQSEASNGHSVSYPFSKYDSSAQCIKSYRSVYQK